MKIKICGITRMEDALLAEDTGAWAIGFIFAEGTPRYIKPETACEIMAGLSEKTEKIGVFVDSSVTKVAHITEIVGITKIQLHGGETPEFCSEVHKITGKEVIKAIRIRNSNDLRFINQYKGYVNYILLDSYSENSLGGTGKIFDWEIAKKAHVHNLPIILAGGLKPENISKAYKKARPFALDISSGIEYSKGIKDAKKLAKLREILLKTQ